MVNSNASALFERKHTETCSMERVFPLFFHKQNRAPQQHESGLGIVTIVSIVCWANEERDSDSVRLATQTEILLSVTSGNYTIQYYLVLDGLYPCNCITSDSSLYSSQLIHNYYYPRVAQTNAKHARDGWSSRLKNSLYSQMVFGIVERKVEGTVNGRNKETGGSVHCNTIELFDLWACFYFDQWALSATTTTMTTITSGDLHSGEILVNHPINWSHAAVRFIYLLGGSSEGWADNMGM